MCSCVQDSHLLPHFHFAQRFPLHLSPIILILINYNWTNNCCKLYKKSKSTFQSILKKSLILFPPIVFDVLMAKWTLLCPAYVFSSYKQLPRILLREVSITATQIQMQPWWKSSLQRACYIFSWFWQLYFWLGFASDFIKLQPLNSYICNKSTSQLWLLHYNQYREGVNQNVTLLTS